MLHEVLEVPHLKARQILNAILYSVKVALWKGERVQVKGFGSFYRYRRKGFIRGNPARGGTVQVKPKTIVKFEPADIIHYSLNKELYDRQFARRNAARPRL